MANLKFENISIKAVAACVPKTIEKLTDLSDLLSIEDATKITLSTGIAQHRIANEDICTSDLAFAATEKLIQDNNLDKSAIEGLIFVSQTPDYRQPATSMSLQHKLGLPKDCLCFDVNLACSGYVYGLSMAYSYVAAGLNNVLLLCGDTLSKAISKHDKATTPLFGDAATATLVGKSETATKTFFSLNSDGALAEVLNIPYGGYRNPSCIKGFDEITNEFGTRNGEQLYMNGIEVFNFGLREAAKDVKRVLEFAQLEPQHVDVFYFHQANKMMTDLIAKKMKATVEKVPYSLERFGNTSSASIPLTIVDSKAKVKQREKSIFCGFGAGLSWGSALTDLSHTKISDLIEI